MALIRHDVDLWSAQSELAWQAGLVPIPIRMTVIRIADGRLLLHSPIELTPELRAELDALGPVGFITVPYAHGRFAEAAAKAWPAAELLAAARIPGGRESLPFRGAVADDPPEAWAGRIESHLVRGFRLFETVFFHVPTRTLVITDLAFHVQRASTGFARFFFRANGMWRSFGPSRVIRRLTVSDKGAFRASIDRICQWDFERILPAHGDVLERGGPAALRAAWRL